MKKRVVHVTCDYLPKKGGGPGGVLTHLERVIQSGEVGAWRQFETMFVSAVPGAFAMPGVDVGAWRYAIRVGSSIWKSVSAGSYLRAVALRRIGRQLRIVAKHGPVIAEASVVHCHDIFSFHAVASFIRAQNRVQPRLVLTVQSPGSATRELAWMKGIGWSTPGLSSAGRYEAEAFASADAIVVPSIGNLQHIVEDMAVQGVRLEVRSDRLHVIYNGISDVVVAPTEIRRVREDLGVGDAAIVLAVGRLIQDKGFDTLIRAMGILWRSTGGALGVQVVIVGDGEERQALERLIEAEQVGAYVRLIGQRSDVPALLAAASLFCTSGRRAAFDLTVLEAFRAGKPVLASAVGGNLEAVDAEVGLLSEPDDPASLASSLAALLRDREGLEKMGRRARVKYEAHYSAEVMASGYYAVYERLGWVQRTS